MVAAAIGGITAGQVAAGAAVVGAVTQIGGSLLASGQQQSAANAATAAQQAQYNNAQQNLAPFIGTGDLSNQYLESLTGTGTTGGNPLTSPLLSPITMSEQTLQQTPGYQFNLNQGLESTQNAAAARGLGVSGAALKGAASYATGLADNTYQNQFSNALTNQNNQFNRLLGLTQLGQTSAAGLSSIGVTTGQGIAGTTLAGGQAAAAGTLGAANALTNAYPNYLANSALSNLYGQTPASSASSYINSTPQQQVADDVASTQ